MSATHGLGRGRAAAASACRVAVDAGDAAAARGEPAHVPAACRRPRRARVAAGAAPGATSAAPRAKAASGAVHQLAAAVDVVLERALSAMLVDHAGREQLQPAAELALGASSRCRAGARSVPSTMSRAHSSTLIASSFVEAAVAGRLAAGVEAAVADLGGDHARVGDGHADAAARELDAQRLEEAGHRELGARCRRCGPARRPARPGCDTATMRPRLAFRCGSAAWVHQTLPQRLTRISVSYQSQVCGHLGEQRMGRHAGVVDQRVDAAERACTAASISATQSACTPTSQRRTSTCAPCARHCARRRRACRRCAPRAPAPTPRLVARGPLARHLGADAVGGAGDDDDFMALEAVPELVGQRHHQVRPQVGANTSSSSAAAAAATGRCVRARVMLRPPQRRPRGAHDRRFAHRQVDQRREDAERDRDPPDDVVAAGACRTACRRARRRGRSRSGG